MKEREGKMYWFKENKQHVLREFETDCTVGLTECQIDARLHRYGKNEFEEEKIDTLFQKILHHLKEIPTLILIVAAMIAAYTAIFHPPDTIGRGWPKVIVILSIVVINIILGIWQEGKAAKALNALKRMNTFKTTVIREARKYVVDAVELVPGDLIEITTGDVITADARLVHAQSLEVDEAPLTGESQPVEKDSSFVANCNEIPLGDRINMIYSGCLVTRGNGKAIVTATAMSTEMGKIAKLLNNTQKLKTPLQLRLQQLAKRISLLALIAGALMLGIGVLIHGNDMLDMLILATALGVAAVPETLPIIVTMVLSIGVFNMVQKRSIIRKIPAVETLGNTSVICSDKTGTLTQNKMKIRKIWHVNHKPIHYRDEFNSDQKSLIELMASCSNATIENYGEDSDEEIVLGDPTELAIIRQLHRLDISRVQAERDFPRVFELPFDSGRKRMTTVHNDVKNGGFIVVTKGAFDRLPLNENKELLATAQQIHDEFASTALRVLGVSTKRMNVQMLPPVAQLTVENLECDQQLCGLVGMIDPPREESRHAVALAKEAGIKTVMITGDHKETAKAIAKEIGIYDETHDGPVLTGMDLEGMSDNELFQVVPNTSVYARVSPEDKIRIVQAWQEHNHVVAMTGDGVNDAPALRAADVGIAMGITGTEVSKNAADMVITDDNFATIVDAVSVGRTSFDNIRKTIVFLLSVNFAEIFILLVGMLAVGVSPLMALQILLINVVADGIPGFFLAFEKADKNVMKRKPLNKHAGVFSGDVGSRITKGAIWFSIITLGAFLLGSYVNIDDLTAPSYAVGISMAFIVLSFASVLNILNVRSTLSIFQANYQNKGLFLAVVGSLGFTFFVALNPSIAEVFDVVSISLTHWLIVIGMSLSVLVFGELVKLVKRIVDKR